MKCKNKIIQQNTAAINEFLDMYGPDTKKEMSEFLFTLQASYLTQPGVCWTKDGASEIVSRFGLLYRLVNGIKGVKD